MFFVKNGRVITPHHEWAVARRHNIAIRPDTRKRTGLLRYAVKEGMAEL